MAEIAVTLATMLGIGSDERRDLRRAALLHDVGKLGVSSRILDKPGTLTRNEWEVLRCHPRWSMEILTRVRAFQELGRIAGAHHERLDGSGYFAGLTADELDLPSRILAVADVAEALSAERPYRPALGHDEVLRHHAPGRRSEARLRRLSRRSRTRCRRALPVASAELITSILWSTRGDELRHPGVDWHLRAMRPVSVDRRP